MSDMQCKTVKANIDAQLDAGDLQRDQGYADAWLSGVSNWSLRGQGRTDLTCSLKLHSG